MPDFVDTVKGCIAFVEPRYDDSAALLGRAADALAASSKQKLLVTNMAGNACWYAGRIAEAAARYRSQRELARDRGDQFQLAQSSAASAVVAHAAGDTDTAAMRLVGVIDDACRGTRRDQCRVKSDIGTSGPRS